MHLVNMRGGDRLNDESRKRSMRSPLGTF